MLGKSIVLGGGLLLLAAGAAEAQYFRVPPGHLPPPGLCRVWLPDRPAGLQPAPTTCATAERRAARFGGRVIYGGSGGPLEYLDPRDDVRFMRWAMRNYDFNRDGYLSRYEYRRARNAYYR